MPKIDACWKFKGMSLLFKIRDTVYPRRKVLSEVGIKPGDQVLDYGCGPGGYIRSTMDLIGTDGKYYALDISPFAVKAVKEMTRRSNITEVATIQSDLDTGLNNESIDVVLLYDIFHMLDNQVALLQELHRVLKPSGMLSFSDHHMKESDILSRVTGEGLFELTVKGKKTYSFVRK